MSIEYRLVPDSDYDHEAIIRIGRSIRPDAYISVADMLDWEANQLRAGRLFVRWLLSVDDDIVGSAYVGQSPWLATGTLYGNVMVHTDHQGSGHGRELLERLEGSAGEHGAHRIIGQTEERAERSNRFVQAAGYEEIDRNWRSTLDLRTFEPGAWTAVIGGVTSQGIRFVPVTELREQYPEWKQEIHRLYIAIEQDVPEAVGVVEVPFEDFESSNLGRVLIPDGFLVAMDGDTMIGLTEPQGVEDEPTALSQDLTGVRADYRGRGIATALKATAAIWAKEQGYTSMRTYNAQSNAPMLAVNTRLGYEREFGQIEYAKTL